MSKKKPEPKRITLTFDLLELPTAQHRAGPAGLILQIDAMGPNGYRRDPGLVPVIDEVSLTTATITFTRDSMQGVFDELYMAMHVEHVFEKRWSKLEPKPGKHFIEKRDPKSGEVKRLLGFAYDVVQPQAPCLRRFLPDQCVEAWVALWRQMVSEILRGGNNVRSRVPFIARAGDLPCGEGASAWSELCEHQANASKSRFKTAPISGALMLGAQAVNAEVVPFSGRVDHNLLLHFWQVVVMTFVPQVVSKKEARVERLGYVLAIPDVSDLVEFRAAFPEILGGLIADHPNRTPAAGRVDHPAQANLEFLRRLREEAASEADNADARILKQATHDHSSRKHIQPVVADKALGGGWKGCVRAVESFHVNKTGNNIKMLSFARVADRPGLVGDYERIAKEYRNPLFRAALMRALIEEVPWYGLMIELFAEYPWPFFLEGTPRRGSSRGSVGMLGPSTRQSTRTPKT